MAIGWWHYLLRKLGEMLPGKPQRELILKKDLESSEDALNFKLTIDLIRAPLPNLGLPPEAVPGLSIHVTRKSRRQNKFRLVPEERDRIREITVSIPERISP